MMFDKRFTLTILSFFFICITAGAQTVDEKINAKIAELRQTGVDTLIKFDTYCNGSISVVTDEVQCRPLTLKYLLWTKNNRNYIQRFDECNNYKVLPVNNRKFNFLKIHINDILNEEIKPVQIKEMDTEIGKKRLLTVTQSHSCITNLTFLVKFVTSYKRVNRFYLTTKYVNSTDYTNGKRVPVKRINDNFTTNQSTYLKRLVDMIDEELKEAKFQKLN